MTTRSNSAAAVVPANAAFLKPSVKRINNGSTCIILGITNGSIKCAGCTNVEQKCLISRKMKTATIHSRLYKCGQPWVLKGKTDQLVQIYENTWRELVDVLGYPSRKLPDSSNRSKIRKVPPSFEVSKGKKQKVMPPVSDVNMEASNLSCSTPKFLGSSFEAPSSSPFPPIEQITTACEGDTTCTTPSTLSPLSDLTPS